MPAPPHPRILLEFYWVTDALDWFDRVRQAGWLLDTAELYCPDQNDPHRPLDFVIRSLGARAQSSAVRENLHRLITEVEHDEMRRRDDHPFA